MLTIACMVSSRMRVDETDLAVDPGLTPAIQSSYLTDERLELADWMRRYAPSLADLYLGAVHLLFGPAIPGRVVLICHAVREICNRLPGYVSGIETGGRLEYSSRVGAIAKQWAQAGLGLDAAVPLDPEPAVAGTDVAMTIDVRLPPQLYVSLAKLIRDHSSASAKPEETARRLFQTAAPETTTIPAPVILQWLGLRKWFVAKAHDSGRVDADFDDGELFERFDLLERTLLSVARRFYGTMDELDAILAETNK